jgi:O-antigen/teichoic acid export membrane protein
MLALYDRIEPRPIRDVTAEDMSERVPTINRRSFIGVGAASLVSAGVGFAVILIAPKILSVADTAIFLTFWSFLFAWYGILGGLSAETTRAVHTSDRITSESQSAGADAPERREPRMLSVGLGVGVGLGVLLWATSFWWAPLLLGAQFAFLAIPLSCSIALFSGHATIVGILGGRLQWATFARLVIADSLLRLALVVTAAVVTAAVAGLAVAASVSSVTWLIGLAFSPTLRAAARARADVSLGPFLRRIGHACLASGSSAVLVVGFPVILSLTSTTAAYAAAAPLLVAITFTRAPLLIPLNAYQGVAIAHFLNNRTAGLRAIAPVARLIALVALGGAILAFFLGPWLMTLYYGPAYFVDPWIVGGLVIAAGMLAMLTITGALSLALDRHSAYSAGWIAATVLAILILLLPIDIEVRSVLALVIGPLAGLVVHFAAIRPRPGRSERADDAGPAIAGPDPVQNGGAA